MSASPEKVAEALRVSMKENEQLRQQNLRLREASKEPIAIVGMSCRYPGGVSSPTGLWQLLAEGRDAIEPFPADRGWDLERLYDPDPDSPGTSYVREGGFLRDAADFDALFFSISPNEALASDPQQRLLLEASWQALEDAGIDPEALHETQTGVFAGVMHGDYGETPGATTSVVSGRIAYALGLQGPTLTVDTACSSSLVAMHLAAQALRSGECSLALAGGVSVLATPGILVYFSHQRGLAPDGRSKAFADAADGVGLAEGIGVLALERLSDAERNGHDILAVLRGSAVNQDGASNGFTAPNGPSQERVIQQALANAGLSPQDVDAVEAHGTGTTLGDPIEAGALLATYGQDREQALKLGSIKSNIGHAQAAAGVAGVIKMVQAMRHGVLPKTLHVDKPSTHIDWEAGKIELLTEEASWEPDGRPRRAGVSSFGASGTNAHVIIEEAPAPEPAEAAPEDERPDSPLPGALALPLSAKAEPALREAAANLVAHLQDNPELDPADVGFSLATTRTPFEQRAVAVGESREQLIDALGALATGAEPPAIARGLARDQRAPVFLFPGQGAQSAQMTLGLLESSPAFATHIAACEEALEPHMQWSLNEILRDPEGAWLDRVDLIQPALFAVMVSLAKLWRECGVEPTALVGHSQGEIAAAHIAGGLSLDDAALIVAERGKAMAKIAGKGGMLSVSLTAEQLTPRLEPYGERISLAAINGPASLVLSGEPEALSEFLAACEQEEIRAERIAAANCAGHSAQIEALEQELLEAFSQISPTTGQIPLHSTVTGELIDTATQDGAYWYRNLRQTVRLEPVLRSLIEQGERLFVEIAPHPVLGFAVEETIEACLANPEEATVLGTLRRDEGDSKRFALSFAQVHTAGAKLDWAKLYPAAKKVGLPTYPFQRERYWVSTTAAGNLSAAGLGEADHPLLGAAVAMPGEGLLLTGRISLSTHPWLADHAVLGTALLPAAAFVELALKAGEQVGAETIAELTQQAPLILTETGAVDLQVTVSGPDQQGNRPISIHSRIDQEEAGEWALHATGALSSEAPVTPEPLSAWPPEGAEALEVDALYERLAELGFEHGPAFQGLQAAWQDGEEIYAEVSLGEGQREQAGRFAIHPALLDVAFSQALAKTQPDAPAMPCSWKGVALYGAGATSLRLRLKEEGEHLSVLGMDGQGAPVIAVASLIERPLDQSQLQDAGSRSLYRMQWSELGLQPTAGSPPSLAILADAEIEGLQAERHSDLPALLEAIAEGAPVPEAVLFDAGAPTQRQGIPEAARQSAQAALSLLQEWLSAEPLADSRLVFCTERAIATADGESPDLASAALWGLVRSAHSEHPGRFALIDSDASEASLAALPAAAGEGEEPQLALREGKALAPRLAPAKPSEAEEEGALCFDPDRTVLITGGLSGLGALFARHLASHHGARHLLLVSRSGEEAPGAKELRDELEGLGAEVTIAACDVSDRDQLEQLIGSIGAEHRLGAVIHSAGVLDDATIASMQVEQLDRVFATKVDGAHHLHELTEGLDLTAFVLFSSVAGALGGPGQGNYAAANSLLDALATSRGARGLPATSIAWGLWERESGMTSDFGKADIARLARSGIAQISNEQGLELFDDAVRTAASQMLAVNLDRASLRSRAAAGNLPPLFSGLIKVSARRRVTSGSLATRLAGVPEAEREAFVLGVVRGEVASVLGHDSAAAVEPERAFKELGFDSLGAVELRNRLASATGLRLPTTLVFDYPTSARLAGHLLGEVSRGGGAGQVVLRAQSSEEPIAIVGMACRYPGGAGSPEELWELVAEGRDGISGFPADRGWDLERLYDPGLQAPGTSYYRDGGFLGDAGGFDAEFFGISPREALAIDPQQRLLLEASWQALEDAEIDPSSLQGSPTGVFAGISFKDYMSGAEGRSAELDGYRLTGGATSVISGRVAYSLGLEGPAITVDTACSASLVAMHLAAQALRGGECSLALAGGVTVLATPNIFVEFSRQGGLAADGRCKAFADAADGTGFAEGVGILALERLSDARRNGHPILAVVKGSAVNQDGASNGLTAPNGPSQERVIQQALANARLEAKDVDVVEAHGTGTTLGDPIEAGALLATYGQDRDEPLKLGSVKSNIGHTQGAAGVAGVIKMVQAMRHGVLPRTLHVDAPSTKVDWEAGEIELLTEPAQWEPNGRPRRAGVSSFGISGTNAHVILEEAPAPEPVEALEGVEAPQAPLPGTLALPLSAKSEAALREAAANLATHLSENPELELSDVGYSLTTTRALFEQRAVVIGKSRDELQQALQALSAGEPSPNFIAAKAQNGRLAYLFTGQGAQRPGMGKELYAASPVFAAALEEACEAIDPHLDHPLKELLFAKEDSPQAALLDQTTFTQPALFAIELALFRLLESLGLSPDYLTGHSIGELSAAHLSGVLSLKDAAKLIAARGALMGELPQGGAMIAIEATEAEVKEALEGKEQELSIAAINGPTSVVISGEEAVALQVQADFDKRDHRTKRLSVSHAFHSPLIEPMLAPFAEVAKSLDYQEPRIPIISTLTGELLTKDEATDPAYWVAQVRGAVRFADAIASLDEQGTATYLELGPEAVLTAMAASCLEGSERQGALIATLRSGRAEQEAIASAIASAHTSGAKLELARLYPNAKRVALPTYPFQRERYWLSASQGPTDASAIGQGVLDHPLLGAAIEDPDGERLTLTGRISLTTHPWLADHAVLGTVILPGTAFVELALKAAEQVGAQSVAELTLQAPMVLAESGAVDLQVAVSGPDEQGNRPISIHSRADQVEAEAGEWTLHATGNLSPQAQATPEPLGAWPPEGAEPIDSDGLYERLTDFGLDFGPAFQGLGAAWSVGEDIYAEVSLPEERRAEAGRFAVHPALLDAALHGSMLRQSAKESELGLPFVWSGVRVSSPGASSLRAKLSSAGGRLSLAVYEQSGRALAAVDSLLVRSVDPAQLRIASAGSRSLFGVQWSSLALQEPNGSLPRLAVLGELSLGGLEAESHPDLKALRTAIEQGAPAPDIVLVGPGVGEEDPDPPQAAHAHAQRLLALLGEFIAAEPLADAKLALISEGALATDPQESPDLTLAAALGLLRSASSEHPGRFLAVDLDRSEASLAALPAALIDAEPQVALREGAAMVPRAAKARLGEQAPQPLDPDRTVLITGATGALGAIFARHLAEAHGARHLLLVSRSGEEAPGAKELEQELTELGAKATIAACDVSEADQLAQLLASVPDSHPLGAVIHTAGVIEDGVIGGLSPEQLHRVLAPKVDGAWNLHRATEGHELSHFVLFSSLAGVLGATGQGNYAAANSFLDALAAARHAQGLPASSIAWGLWEGEGMIGTLDEANRSRLARFGIAPLSAERGLELFDLAPQAEETLLIAAPLDFPTLRGMAEAGMLPPLLSGLIRTPARRPGAGSLAETLASVPEAEREAVVLGLVRGEVAAVLGHDSAEAVDPERALTDLGFDSLAAVELRNRLVGATGVLLQPTAVFDYPSSEKLARHLFAQVVVGEDAGTELQEVEISGALARLEELLSGIEQDDLLRRNTHARLRAFLANLSDSALLDEAEGSGGDLEALSNDEIFKLIDEEFGGEDLTQTGQAPGEEGS